MTRRLLQLQMTPSASPLFKDTSRLPRAALLSLLGLQVACAKTSPPEAPEQTSEPPAAEPTPEEQPAKEDQESRFAPPEASATALLKGENLKLDAKGDEAFWKRAQVVKWDTDWQGSSTGITTSVRLAYEPEKALYLFWELEGAAFSNNPKDAKPEVENRELWKYDVAEIFLGGAEFPAEKYFEIEVGPMDHFFDLVVNHHLPEGDPKRDDLDWSSGLRKKVIHDPKAKKVTIEMALEGPDIAKLLIPEARLPMALYRIEGTTAPNTTDGHFYLAWSPTMTEVPAFHVPGRFGRLLLQK